MSKQDIEKRLGFAAQGVKAEFAADTSFSDPRPRSPARWTVISKRKNNRNTKQYNATIGSDRWQIDSIQVAGSEYGSLSRVNDSGSLEHIKTGNALQLKRDAESASSMGVSVQEALARGKRKSARLGAKAEMAAPANWESKLDAKNLADSFDVEGLRELLGSAKEIARKYPQYKALGQKMADGINMVVSAVKQMKDESMKASRPGVKTEFAADKRTTAGALRKALKAKGITSAADLEWHGISAKDPDSTPYWLYEDGSMEKIKSSRQGVKAEFAKPQFRTKKLHNGYIAVEVNQGSGWERYDTTHEESWNGIEEYERGYQKAYDRGLRYSGGAWRIPSTTASRPAAKAKA